MATDIRASRVGYTSLGIWDFQRAVKDCVHRMKFRIYEKYMYEIINLLINSIDNKLKSIF